MVLIKRSIVFLSIFIFNFNAAKAQNEHIKPNIESIVAFGDSLSDNGNYLSLSKKLEKTMPLEPYFAGRASNGKVWVEYLAQSTEANLINYAFVGALTYGENKKYPKGLDLLSQVKNYKTQYYSKKPNPDKTLYTIWIGANNIFSINLSQPIITYNRLFNLTDEIIDNLNELVDYGAKYIFIGSIPDLGNTPLTNDIDSYKKMKIILSGFTKFENYLLNKKIEKFKEKNKNVTIIYFDTNEMFNKIKQNPGRFFISNIKNSCYKGVPNEPPPQNVSCENSKDYLFWDLVHPSTKIHCFAAIEIEKNLSHIFQSQSKSKLQDKFCSELN